MVDPKVKHLKHTKGNKLQDDSLKDSITPAQRSEVVILQDL